jgi:hypothetical protein
MDLELGGMALDPIGDFLESHRRAGASLDELEEQREMLTGFRRANPGRPLTSLGRPELDRYVQELKGTGIPPAEVGATERLVLEFFSYSSARSSHGARLSDLPAARARHGGNLADVINPAAQSTVAAAAVGGRTIMNLVLMVAIGGAVLAALHFYVGIF